MGRPKKKTAPTSKNIYQGVKIIHGRPVQYVVSDDPRFYEQIHKRKSRIFYTIIGMFFLSYAYIVGDIFYTQVFSEEVDKIIYML
ncbi:MAG: hypothetical protein CMA64_06975 [Euryarchaeota archaeon]|nr:hypothetical protein [Euryarchaeota archaeon]